MTLATEGISSYIDVLDEYELNILAWMESSSSSTDFEGWAIYQLSRAVTCFRSCKNLITSGDNTDALALSRTMQDIYILVQWVSMNPQTKLKNATVDEVLKQRVYDARRMFKKSELRPNNVPYMPDSSISSAILAVLGKINLCMLMGETSRLPLDEFRIG